LQLTNDKWNLLSNRPTGYYDGILFGPNCLTYNYSILQNALQSVKKNGLVLITTPREDPNADVTARPSRFMNRDEELKNLAVSIQYVDSLADNDYIYDFYLKFTTPPYQYT
jgi:hypothetical protein